MLFTHIDYIAATYLLTLAVLCTTKDSLSFVFFKFIPCIFGILLLINKISPIAK